MAARDDGRIPSHQVAGKCIRAAICGRMVSKFERYTTSPLSRVLYPGSKRERPLFEDAATGRVR